MGPRAAPRQIAPDGGRTVQQRRRKRERAPESGDAVGGTAAIVYESAGPAS